MKNQEKSPQKNVLRSIPRTALEPEEEDSHQNEVSTPVARDPKRATDSSSTLHSSFGSRVRGLRFLSKHYNL